MMRIKALRLWRRLWKSAAPADARRGATVPQRFGGERRRSSSIARPFEASGTDGQWIDVTGLQAGDYVLEIEVNAERFFQETDYSNNSASIRVTLPKGLH